MTFEAEAFSSFDDAALTLWRGPTKPARPTVHWAHATGFSALTYRPLLSTLVERVNVLAWDMRGHGLSNGSGIAASFKGWETYYRDMIALLDECPEPIWLAGHSIGATCSLVAACRRPEKVRGLLLCEPVILDLRSRLGLRLMRALGRADRVGLAKGAARRRATFGSRKEAFENYRARSAFRSWADEWLQAYVDAGFTLRGDEGVTLACSPQWESLTFQHTESSPWKRIRPLPFEVRILAGTQSSTFPQSEHRRFQNCIPGSKIFSVGNASHFLPMERPDSVINELFDLIAVSGPEVFGSRCTKC